MVLGTNIKKAKDAGLARVSHWLAGLAARLKFLHARRSSEMLQDTFDEAGASAAPFRGARPGPRRSWLFSRLTQLILVSNLIGLLILVTGALTMNRFEAGLINAKVDTLRSLAATITTVMSEQATGFGGAAELDIEGAKQVLRGVNVPDGWRVRLHDRRGQVVADTARLDNSIEVSPLDPIQTGEPPKPPLLTRWRNGLESSASRLTHNLPWRKRRRESLRRDLKQDVKTVLGGESVAGPRYDDEDNLIVMASMPVTRVRQILGSVTVEADDVGNIVAAERQALAPIIGLALFASLLSSLFLILFISIPMRRLSRAAEQVARNPEKFSAIPDLSGRRDEIGDLSTVMRDMTRELYNRVDDIANFAADVAHEIKNPLTSLRSASDTLRVAKTDAQREQLIDIIAQDVGRMNRLITDISHASKVDANLARDQAQTLEVAEIVENIVTFYEQTRDEKSAAVVDETQLDGPVFIRAFETPFAQVLRNLIDNAITFSSADGEVRVRAFERAGKVRIVVDDDGPGIPPDNLQTVFERFYTERPEGATFGSHSGLGLSICRQIMTAHKGRIWAENRTGKAGAVQGASFVIELPQHKQGGGPAPSKQKRL